MSDTKSIIRNWGMANLMAEIELSSVEDKYGLDFARPFKTEEDIDFTYYPQFQQVIREEAKEMSHHYEIFYCLEKFIRTLIQERLEEVHGLEWWKSKIPEHILTQVAQNKKKEMDNGITIRSTNEIDYTNFGDLGEIIKKNWTDFQDMFNSLTGVLTILAKLNLLRSPIAHCSKLADDEVTRLQLALRDWFKQME